MRINVFDWLIFERQLHSRHFTILCWLRGCQLSRCEWCSNELQNVRQQLRSRIIHEWDLHFHHYACLQYLWRRDLSRYCWCPKCL